VGIVFANAIAGSATLTTINKHCEFRQNCLAMLTICFQEIELAVLFRYRSPFLFNFLAALRLLRVKFSAVHFNDDNRRYSAMRGGGWSSVVRWRFPEIEIKQYQPLTVNLTKFLNPSLIVIFLIINYYNCAIAVWYYDKNKIINKPESQYRLPIDKKQTSAPRRHYSMRSAPCSDDKNSLKTGRYYNSKIFWNNRWGIIVTQSSYHCRPQWASDNIETTLSPPPFIFLFWCVKNRRTSS